MRNAAIIYRISPSFDEGSKLHVEISWVEHRKEFKLDIQCGIDKSRRWWFKENAELKSILDESSDLSLPLLSGGPIGLDGTTYSLQFGHSPSVAFTWWQEVPSEWSQLVSIVNQIEGVVDKMKKRSEQGGAANPLQPSASGDC
jgi:hypothetical protein